MKMNLLKPLLMMVFFLVLSLNLRAGNPDHISETIVNKLYKLLTLEKGTTPEWDRVRQLF